MHDFPDLWFHERTEDGWQILDENRPLVAFAHDALHECESDAIRVADSRERNVSTYWG